MKKYLLLSFLFSFLLVFVAPLFSLASAHEIYVLPHQTFQEAFAQPPVNTLAALSNPVNLHLTLLIACFVTLVLCVLTLLRYTPVGLHTDAFLKKASPFAGFLVRLSLAASLLYGGFSNALFGPEVSLSQFPLHQLLGPLEIICGLLLLVGLCVRVAAGGALILYILSVTSYGMYSLTYLNYLGEILILLFAEASFLSLDRYVFAKKKTSSAFEKYQTTISRIFYGSALLYTAITVKIIHSATTLDVVTDYHLTRFHLLFPSDPLLVVLGAAIVEITMALFIIVGFSVRITNLVLVFYLTLSILFFRETVWPHFMLYGISLSLLFNGAGQYSIDSLLRKVFVKK